MNARPSRTLLPLVCLVMVLSGCGSSTSNSDDDGLLDDPGSQDDGADTSGDAGTDTGADTGGDSSGDAGTDTGADTGADSSGDAGTDTGADTGTDSSGDAGTDTGADTAADSSGDAGTDTGADTGADSSGDAGTDTGADTGADSSGDAGTDTGADTGTDSSGDAGTDTGADTGADTGGDTGTDSGGDDKPDGDDIVIPNVEDGSDLDRLITGIHQQVARTLIALNVKINSGEELSELEDQCLGAYDPALGEQLTEIDCQPRQLATGNISLYVTQAAFHDTPECHASLLEGNSDSCFLQRAGLVVPTSWQQRATGGAQLLYEGSVIDYGVKDSEMTLQSTGDALRGHFSCSVDLLQGSTTSNEPGASCSDPITHAADELDRLLASE